MPHFHDPETIQPVVIAKGDHLAEAFRDLVHQNLFANLPAVFVDLSSQNINEFGRHPVAMEFVEATRQYRTAIKISTASADTQGGSINPLWRKSLRAVTAWRQLLVPQKIGPCAVARLQTGSIYSHSAANILDVGGRQIAQFVESWDLTTLEQCVIQTLEKANALGWMIVLPNKGTVSASQRLFVETVTSIAQKMNTEIQNVLSDTFLATIARDYAAGGWVALTDDLTGDLLSDILVVVNEDFAMSSDQFCEDGILVCEQPGGTNKSMLENFQKGLPVKHAFIDILHMYKTAYTTANPHHPILAEKMEALYSLALEKFNKKPAEWDSVSLLKDIKTAAEQQNIKF